MRLTKILLGLFFTFSFLLSPFNAQAQVLNAQNTQVVSIEARPIDKRAQIIKDYLAKKNAPLEDSAQDFVDAADKYGIDWKLVVSISGVESGFGKHIPGGHDPLYTSYNGWGWGVYGDNSLGFKSWREAIFTISEGLRKNYIDKGYTEPLIMNKKYASSPTWGVRVAYFMNDLETYAKSYPFDVELTEIEVAKAQILPETKDLKTLLANNSHTYSLDVLK
jgi:beta-N-acetylglucosaminidase